MEDIDKLLRFFAKYEKEAEVIEESLTYRLTRSFVDDRQVLILEERNPSPWRRQILTLTDNYVKLESYLFDKSCTEVEVEIEKAYKELYQKIRKNTISMKSIADFKKLRNDLLDEQTRLSNHVEKLAENIGIEIFPTRTLTKQFFKSQNLKSSTTFFRSLKCSIIGREYHTQASLRFEHYFPHKTPKKNEVVEIVEFTADKGSDVVSVSKVKLKKEIINSAIVDKKIKEKIIELIQSGGDLQTVDKFYEEIKAINLAKRDRKRLE